MIGTKDRAQGAGVWLFFLITFGWSWSIAAALHLSGGELSLISAVLYMAGPGVAAFLCAFIYDRHRFFVSLGLKSNPFNKWLLIAFLTPILIAVITHLATIYIGGREMLSLESGFTIQIEKAGIDPETLPMTVKQIAILQVLTAPFVAAIVNTIGMMLTEEVGWRGWLWDRWSHMPFWHHALLTGLIWGIWHAPIIALGYNYPDLPVWGPVIFTVLVMLITPIIALIREAGGSMVHAAMFHGMFNGMAPLTVILMADPTMPWLGLLGLGGFGTLAIGVVIVFFFRRRQGAD